MITIILKIDLTYPYNVSLGTLLEFCKLWDSSLLSGGTNDNNAKISMPLRKFKKLFKSNPKQGRYTVPNGAGYFIEEIEVIDINVN